MSKLFVALLFFARAYAATETDLGPLFGFQKSFEISLSDCSRVWKIDSNQAGCEVHLFDRSQSFLVSPTTTLSYWKYAEDEGWGLSVSIQRTVYGYSIQLNGIGDVPASRLQFSIAKKYLTAALGEGSLPSEKSPYFSQMITLEPRRSDSFIPLRFKKRTLAFRSEDFIKELFLKLSEKKESKKTFILQFGKYGQGEMVWSEAQFEAQSSLGSKNSLKVALAAWPAWKYLGGASLGYMRVDFSGDLTLKNFSDLYKQAIQDIPVNDFSVVVQTTKQNDNLNLKEEDLGVVRLLERRIDFDLQACEKAWIGDTDKGQCRVPVAWTQSRRVGANNTLFDGASEVENQTVQLLVTADDQGYLVQAFGQNDGLEKFANVRKFLEKALTKRQFKDFSIRILN